MSEPSTAVEANLLGSRLRVEEADKRKEEPTNY